MFGDRGFREGIQVGDRSFKEGIRLNEVIRPGLLSSKTGVLR